MGRVNILIRTQSILAIFLTMHLNINGTCLSISNATNNLFYCDQNNTPFLLLLIPNILQGLSFFLVFMTALEFICAQAPLRLKGLLIGLWYALLATNYLLVEVPELFTVSSFELDNISCSQSVCYLSVSDDVHVCLKPLPLSTER